ncbi:Zinc finger C2H2 protein [Dictyocoela muelleri]|nr:Zinc finger C2H2 protein [Dictyocoela muelleri]
MKCLWENCSFTGDQENMNKHISSHIEEKFCKWETCKTKSYEWSNKYTFIAHIRKHIGVTPFKCEKCDKIYTRAEPLKQHMKKHEKFKKENEIIVQKINELKIVLDEYNIKIKEEERKKDNYLTTISKIKTEIKDIINKNI